MVVIRLSRFGQKGTPVYRILVSDKAAKLSGRFIEKLGTLRLTSDGATSKKSSPTDQRYVMELNRDRFQFWVGKGAIPSERLAKVVKDFKINEGAVAAKAPALAKAPKAAPAPVKAAQKAAPTSQAKATKKKS